MENLKKKLIQITLANDLNLFRKVAMMDSVHYTSTWHSSRETQRVHHTSERKTVHLR